MLATNQHRAGFRERSKEELPTDKNEKRVSCHSTSVEVGDESLDPAPCKWDSLVDVLETVGEEQLAGSFTPGADAVVEPCHAQILALAKILEISQVVHRCTVMSEHSEPIHDVFGTSWWCRELNVVLENQDGEFVPKSDS